MVQAAERAGGKPERCVSTCHNMLTPMHISSFLGIQSQMPVIVRRDDRRDFKNVGSTIERDEIH